MLKHFGILAANAALAFACPGSSFGQIMESYKGMALQLVNPSWPAQVAVKENLSPEDRSSFASTPRRVQG